MKQFDALNNQIVTCTRCPRLIEWCQTVANEKRKSFINDKYWGKPVPNLGDPNPTGLIIGLAPAAHGANRTGRMFTGDRSGDWLFRALHRAKLANQPNSTSNSDGLVLDKVIITATCHCAPPQNKPTSQELKNCESYLLETLDLAPYKAILCLGSIAWNQFFRLQKISPIPKFGHGVKYILSNSTTVIACYHPSQQNTFTGKLTEEMLDQVMQKFADLVQLPLKEFPIKDD